MCCCKRKSKPKAWSKLCKLREKKKTDQIMQDMSA